MYNIYAYNYVTGRWLKMTSGIIFADIKHYIKYLQANEVISKSIPKFSLKCNLIDGNLHYTLPETKQEVFYANS